MLQGLLAFVSLAGMIALPAAIYKKTENVIAPIAVFVALFLTFALLPGRLGMWHLDLLKHPLTVLALWVPAALLFFSSSGRAGRPYNVPSVSRRERKEAQEREEALREARKRRYAEEQAANERKAAEEKAKREKIDKQIEAAKRLMDEGKYKEAIEAFRALPEGEERAMYISECATKIADAKEAIRGLNDAYVDKEAEKRKSKAEIYDAASNFYKNKEYSVAAQGFDLAEGYKDAKALYIKASLPVLAQNGGTLRFGTFPQWPDKEAQDIEWIGVPVSKTGTKDRVLLVSKYALKILPFHEEKEEISWAGCSLRTWLNQEFYDTFKDREKQLIVETPLRGYRDETEKDHAPSLDTKDKIFILSPQEEKQYLEKGGVKATPQAYKEANPKSVVGDTCFGIHSWLRKTWTEGKTGAVLHEDGTITTIVYSVSRDDIGVRPAMYVKLPEE